MKELGRQNQQKKEPVNTWQISFFALAMELLGTATKTMKATATHTASKLPNEANTKDIQSTKCASTKLARTGFLKIGLKLFNTIAISQFNQFPKKDIEP